MGPWCSMARQQKCNCSHLSTMLDEIKQCQASGTYNLTQRAALKHNLKESAEAQAASSRTEVRNQAQNSTQ